MRSRLKGAVAAGDKHTVEAALEVLEAGGNAVDAVIGAACASYVCEAPLCSPLGGAVMLVELDGEVRALDGFARMPGLGAAKPTPRDLEFFDVEVDFGATTQAFHIGSGSTALPLALPMLVGVQQRWGRLPLSSVVAPAVRLGNDGYEVGDQVAFIFELLRPIVTRTEGMRRIYFGPDGELARAGVVLRNSDLAALLHSLGQRPRPVLRDIYQALAKQCGRGAGGLITQADIEPALDFAQDVSSQTPLCVQHGDVSGFTMPAPSVGGALIALGLQLLEGVGAESFLSAEHLLKLVQVQEQLLSVRGSSERFDEQLAEPDFVAQLLSATHVRELRARTAAPQPDNHLGSTTHISVCDADGNVVALTQSNGEGSGHVLTGTGMQLNNLLGEEDINPRGFHVDAPGHRLATMMAPTILLGSEERLALGSGGSNRLRNAILAVACHRLEHRVPLTEAVSAPRLHVDVKEGAFSLAYEAPDLPAAAEGALHARFGDNVARFGARNMFFGGVHVVAAHVNGHLDGVGDSRRGGMFGRC